MSCSDESDVRKPIGLIGLGLVGQALATRLLQGHQRVVGFDVQDNCNARLRAAGGAIVSGPQDVFARADRVLLSLPTEREVCAVLIEADAVLRPSQTIIDTSTCDPDASSNIAQSLESRGVAYLDATISGSSEHVARGEALFMVGGDRDAFDRCADLWPLLTRESMFVGPSGSGSRMKLVTNLVLGLNRAALAEGLCLAAGLQLDLSQTLEVLLRSAAYSRIMDSKGEKMVRRDFTPAARLSQHLKDVRLMLAAAEQTGTALPLTETHRRLLEDAVRLGLGDLDNSALLLAIEAAARPTSESPTQEPVE